MSRAPETRQQRLDFVQAKLSDFLLRVEEKLFILHRLVHRPSQGVDPEAEFPELIHGAKAEDAVAAGHRDITD